MAKYGKRLGFLPGWSKSTYIILAFNVFMLAWVIGSASSGSVASGDATSCGSLSQSDCNTAQGIGTSIAEMLLIPLWAMGDIILGVIWLVANIVNGHAARKSHSHDRRTAAVSPAPAPA